MPGPSQTVAPPPAAIESSGARGSSVRDQEASRHRSPRRTPVARWPRPRRAWANWRGHDATQAAGILITLSDRTLALLLVTEHPSSQLFSFSFPTSLLLRSRTYVARSGCLWTLVWVYTSRATARVPLLALASRALSGTVPLSALPCASSPQSPSGTTTLVHVNLDVLAKARDVPSARRVVVVLLGHLALARNALEL